MTINKEFAYKILLMKKLNCCHKTINNCLKKGTLFRNRGFFKLIYIYFVVKGLGSLATLMKTVKN